MDNNENPNVEVTEEVASPAVEPMPELVNETEVTKEAPELVNPEEGLVNNEELTVSPEITEEVSEPIVEEKPKKKKKGGIVFLVILLIVLILVNTVGVYFIYFKGGLPFITKQNQSQKRREINRTITPVALKTEYTITSNGLTDFDLYFMKEENKNVNKVYSPLSIKYALEMLAEGADGETKTQLDTIIGNYVAKKYTNSANMSFANAMFIKEDYKPQVLESYTTNLQNKYYAEVRYDAFTTPDAINKWISDKTFNLIDKMFDDVSAYDYVLVNALAIDMEWEDKINKLADSTLSFPNENYHKTVGGLMYGYTDVAFEGMSEKASSVGFAAAINNYDIVNVLGEEKIKSTLNTELVKFFEEHKDYYLEHPEEKERYEGSNWDEYVEHYISDLKRNYKISQKTTDFKFYADDDVKMFAKDLKEYNGLQLEYVAIMPKTQNLDTYVKNITASQVNSLIKSLKIIDSSSTKDGVITEIAGSVPMFNFSYDLKLKEDLINLGLTDVFDSGAADLSKLTQNVSYIADAAHKATIDFSNDGIKAAAVTALGGLGSAFGTDFYYYFEVPVETIDLTFDKPYMYIIRDKSTGEVWFAGTVYEPSTALTVNNHE